MEKLIELLSNTESITFDNAKSLIPEIAELLFTKYILSAGTRKYRLTDIEFYIQTPGHVDCHEKYEDSSVVYPRVQPAARIFFHYSGMDICFESHIVRNKKKVDNEKSSYGGILIRGLERVECLDGEDPQIIGPLKCMTTVMNEAEIRPVVVPALVPISHVEYEQTTRVGLSDKHKLPYHFTLCK